MYDLFIDIQSIRVLSAIAMLGIASVMDIAKREVPDYLWMVFAAVAAVLLFFEPNIHDTIVVIGISLLIVPLSILIWRVGIFGGADAFCLIVLSALAPMASI